MSFTFCLDRIEKHYFKDALYFFFFFDVLLLWQQDFLWDHDNRLASPCAQREMSLLLHQCFAFFFSSFFLSMSIFRLCGPTVSHTPSFDQLYSTVTVRCMGTKNTTTMIPWSWYVLLPIISWELLTECHLRGWSTFRLHML